MDALQINTNAHLLPIKHRTITSLFLIFIALISSNVPGVNKCVVNGKVSYQNAPCSRDAKNEPLDAHVSVIDSQGLRDDGKRFKEQEQMRLDEQNRSLKAIASDRRARLADRDEAKRILIMRGKWNASSDVDYKLDEMQRRVEQAESDASSARIEAFRRP